MGLRLVYASFAQMPLAASGVHLSCDLGETIHGPSLLLCPLLARFWCGSRARARGQEVVARRCPARLGLAINSRTGLAWPMLTTLLWLGSVLGMIAGVFHAVNIFRCQAELPGPDARQIAIYRAVWAFALWSLFGAYLLILWIVGALAKPLSELSKRRRAA